MEEELIFKSKCLVPNGYNVLKKGTDRTGFTHSEESKEKIRQSKLGTKFSDKHRKNMSDAHSGEKHHFYGKKRPIDQCENMRKSQKKKEVIQYSKSGEQIAIFESTREAGRAIGINNGSGNISNCCLGKTSSAYGFIWKYLF